MNPDLRKALAVGGVLALLALLVFWPGFGSTTRHPVGSDVRHCTENLRAIYRGLCELERRDGRVPDGSGRGFATILVESGLWTEDAETRARLRCPGGAELSRYAGRDQRSYPLASFPVGGSANEPILACDNAAGPNHEGFHNVLYTDGSVVTLELAAEIEAGRVPTGTPYLVPGPECALEELRMLTASE